MSELRLIGEAMAEVGKDYVSLDFEDHLIWNTLKNLSTAPTSTALIDNTTVHNALTLMREGLGAEDSLRAVLIPDFSLLFFALTHFDDLILLDHGLNPEETQQVQQIFGGVIHLFDWRSALRNDNELKNNLYRKFNSIQGEFRLRSELHIEWANAWVKLLGAEIHPVYFDEELDRLLDSPSHPLHRDAQELGTNWLNVLRVNDTTPRRLPWRSQSLQLDLPGQLSALASYHTFRSIFYYCLSDYLNYPYLPCGTRGIVTNFIPVEFLTRDTDHLNPRINMQLKQLVLLPVYAELPPLVKLPLLGVTPSLAVVMRKMREFDVPNWTVIVAELRCESFEYRKNVRRFLEACTEEAFDYHKVIELARILAGDNALQASSALASSVDIVGSLGLSYVTHNPGQTLGGLVKLSKLRPWELVGQWNERRKLKFILHARDLVTSAFSLEAECRNTWKRGFSTDEREYLERLQRTSALYGL